MFKTLSELRSKSHENRKRRLVIAAAHDPNTIEAAIGASVMGIVDLTLVGDKSKIDSIIRKHITCISQIELVNEPDNDRAAEISVRMVSENHADILMKGHLETSSLLKAALNKDWGLRSGNLLSHLAVFELPGYHKLLALTDSAMNIAPDVKAKVSILNNSVDFLLKLGYVTPKVALLSAIETVNPEITSSIDAATITKMADRGQITNCLVDGPLALDNAINIESATLKYIKSPVAGDADLLVGNDLDSTNLLYKSFIYFGRARCAAVIVGAKVPIVLTSRADNMENKLNSIILAAASHN